ncbi:MAG: alpha/beta hydrolase-fold protein [Verrucomicrobia bacterium]|nr:alpha/beta hydrolase-fold protein [Verrucomicrobiota bacterium]
MKLLHPFETVLKKAFGLAGVFFAVAGTTFTLFAVEPRITELQFHSEVLGRDMPFTLVRPTDEAAANGSVLFLLHGRGRHHQSLIDSDKARAALLEAPFYIVLPKGEDGWYINSPVETESRYEDYLLEVMRVAEKHAPLSRDPRWRAITGWSMGGYGAVRFAERHPEEIGTVSSIIGLLDFPRHPVSEIDGYKVPIARFGDDETVWQKFNPLHGVDALQARRVLIVAATEAFDFGMNQRFEAALTTQSVSHDMIKLPGGHDFAVVEDALPKVIDFCTRSFVFETARNKARHRERRLIFNDDTGYARAFRSPLTTPEQYLSLQVTPLAGTLVDTLAIDTTAGSFSVFGHQSDVAQMFLTQEGRYQYNVLPVFIKLGTDPLKLAIDQGRRQGDEVFWSVRLNDTHDATNPLLFSEFKQAHPDWLMGTIESPPTYGQWSTVDFGRPEVREQLLKNIVDVINRYDIDGVELDFWRHPIWFRSSTRGYAVHPDEVAAMTGLIRGIRAALDREGKRRGRPLVLAAKTPDSVAYCLHIGLDLKQWMAEQLIDLWEPGGYFRLEPWTTDVALAQSHDVAFYACLPENRMKDPAEKEERDSIETLRARALAAWAAGVDGIAMFNFDVPEHGMEIWHELGDPSLLRTLPKKYFASYQGVSSSKSYVPAGAFVKLPTLTPDTPEELAPGISRDYDLYLGDDLRSMYDLLARLEVRLVKPVNLPPTVFWDGTQLDLTSSDKRIWASVPENSSITPGLHRVTVKATSELQLKDVVLHIHPKE